MVGQPAHAPETVLNLSGVTLLYVGGRANQIPRLKALVERAGAQFLHHDGGLEHNAGLLPNLVSRADHVTFPVDCVSHDAVLTIKGSAVRRDDLTSRCEAQVSLACCRCSRRSAVHQVKGLPPRSSSRTRLRSAGFVALGKRR